MSNSVWPSCTGETAALVRTKDWANTPLGPIAAWPDQLRTLVDMVLRTPVGTALMWGERATLIYNDEYARVCGSKHPGTLGCSVLDAWPEAIDFNGAMLAACRRGETQVFHAAHFVLTRNGERRDAWFDLYYSPVVDAAGAVCGVLATVIETTAQVLAEQARAEQQQQLERLNAELDAQRAQLQHANQRLTGDMAFLNSLFEQAPSFMAVLLGPDHVYALANESYKRLIGQRDILHKPVGTALPEVAEQGFIAILDRVYATGKPFYGKNLHVMLDTGRGIERVVLDFVYQPLRDAGGQVYGIFVEGIDVTAHAVAEERLRVAQEAGEVGTFEWYPETGAMTVSDAYRRIWGFDDTVAVNAEMLVSRLDPSDRHLSGTLRLDSANPLEYAEYRITRADTGEQRWVARKGQAINGAPGAPARYLGVAFDITDRKHAEDRLRHTQQQLRDSLDFMHLLLDSTEEAFCAADRKGITTLCNAAFLRMFGHASEAQVLGKPLDAVLRDPRASDGATASHVALAIAGGRIERVADAVLLRSDGTPFPVSYRACPILRDDELHGVLCMITDLTGRKEQDAALRASETRLATVFAQASVGLSEIGLDGRFTRANDALCQMLGRTREELLASSLTDIIHPDDVQQSLDAARELIAHGGSSSIEKRYLRPDGSHVWGYTNVSRIVDAAGRPLALIAVTTDLTERRKVEQALRELNESLERKVSNEVAERIKAEEALRQSQKMEAVGQLASGVAHDFNNVLQIISSNLQLMELDSNVNALLRSRLVHAIAAVERGAKLSSQLLAFARRQPLQPVVTDLGQLLRNIEHLLQRALGDYVQLDIGVAPGLWRTAVDPNQIENAILNMAINARDAMQGAGRLAIDVRNLRAMAAEGGQRGGPEFVSLSISDTGCGMPPEVLAKVFDPFYTTKEPGKGTGLGMSMVYGFVKQSGGEIRIDSSPGTGTTITIDLPRTHEIEPALPRAVNRAVAGGDETILVVEDDPAVRAATTDILASLGYRALKANNGQQALAILQSGMPVDLLFSDVFMPGSVDSIELVTQARAIAPATAILFTSGHSLDDALGGRKMPPEIELLPKPHGREQLARKIRQVLAQRADAAAPARTFAAEPPAETRPGGALRFLVVEDDADACELACEMLAALGHAARGTGSAEEALELLAQERIDVLFTDLNLPGMAGDELATRACAAVPGLAVVLASGEGIVPVAAGDAKVVLLPKPYDLMQLQQGIAEIASAGSRPFHQPAEA